MTTPVSNGVAYYAVNSPQSPKIWAFDQAPTSANNKGFKLLDEWYVRYTQDWYKLVSLDGGTAVWIKQVGQTGGVLDLQADSGDATPDSNGTIEIIGGAGISTSATGNVLTINSSGADFQWEVNTSSTAQLAVNTGYFSNVAGLATYTLPSTAEVGESFSIVAVQGTMKIVLNSGQVIRNGDQVTTPTTGYIESTSDGDAIVIACWSPPAQWVVVSGPQGNFNTV